MMMESRPGLALAAFTAVWMVEWVQPVPVPTLKVLAYADDAVASMSNNDARMTFLRFTMVSPVGLLPESGRETSSCGKQRHCRGISIAMQLRNRVSACAQPGPALS